MIRLPEFEEKINSILTMAKLNGYNVYITPVGLRKIYTIAKPGKDNIQFKTGRVQKSLEVTLKYELNDGRWGNLTFENYELDNFYEKLVSLI